MAFSAIANTKKRTPFGNRWMVSIVIDEVDNTGSFVAKATLGLSQIDKVIGAVAIEDAVSVQAAKNSQTDSQTEDDPGDIWLKTSAGTHDVALTIIGR